MRATVTFDRSLPPPGLAEVRVIAASPDAARQVAQVLRASFASTEQRSYPAGTTGTGTRLHLTVDTTHTPALPGTPETVAGGIVHGQAQGTTGFERTTVPSGNPEPAARLTLLPPGTGLHLIDGAWWPRSHDLGRELPGLITALEERWPHITRVTVSRSMWHVRPGTLLIDGRELHISQSESVPQPHTICLLSYGIGRCDLLVIPPEETPAEAHRLMNATHTHDGTHSGTRVLAF